MGFLTISQDSVVRVLYMKGPVPGKLSTCLRSPLYLSRAFLLVMTFQPPASEARKVYESLGSESFITTV